MCNDVYGITPAVNIALVKITILLDFKWDLIHDKCLQALVLRKQQL